ncbi:MAG: hypothetical protein Q7R35_06515 [Elusimicrobiota bacterium]|nr:hypothetical protein [Elusimicrobiota bacterium]
MIAFICLLALGIMIYVYLLLTGSGGGFSLGRLDEQGGAPPAALRTSPWAVPLALAAGWLLKDIWWLLGFPFHFMCHEVGHSLVAWLGGCWSFPIIAGLAVTDPDPSLFLSALVAGILAWASWQAVKNRNPLLLFCCALLASGFFYLQFIAAPETLWQFILFGGHAGEFFFPALLIPAFYYRGPLNWRWDWLRYPVLAAAACELVFAWSFWLKAGIDPVTGIYGVNISDGSMADMDIARLVAQFGWTARLAADRFLLLGKTAWAFVAIFYIWFLLRRSPEPAVDPVSPVNDK